MSSISGLFAKLGAPLNNPMWSWGSVRESDKTVFLRVWQDGTAKRPELGGRYFSWITNVDESDTSNGAGERRWHVQLVKEGYRCLMVMCQAADDEAKVRQIVDFNDRELFVGGEIAEFDGSLWIEAKSRILVDNVVPEEPVRSGN